MSVSSARLALAALVGADVAVLVAVPPDRVRLWETLAHPQATIATAGSDAVLAGLAAAALWCVAVWLGLGLAAALVTAAPGAIGSAAARLSTALLPRMVHRAVAGAVGLGVLVAPVAAGASVRADGHVPPALPATTQVEPGAPTWPTDAPADPGRAPTVRAGAPTAAARASHPSLPGTSSIPAPAWPRSRPAPRPGNTPQVTPTTTRGGTSAAPQVTPTPAPTAPTSRPPATPASSARGTSPATGRTAGPATDAATDPANDPANGRTAGPATDPATDAANGKATDPATDPATGPVTVRPGDSLWVIAARRLGPRATDREIAAEWPRWYSANRAVVGADPDLVLAGRVLTAPPAPPATTPEDPS